ncbi:hypothetical protein Sjap_004359 [Stephania japonica]|uniref:Aluminum-activated malate transporter n=1 Tax=Stephania japonica TaxID=461633 RepID=A0AAP0K2E7_9MAGN
MRSLVSEVWSITWKVGRDDPRRVIHSLKVGLALCIVSLLFLLEPLFAGIGKNAIWAVMTVVVVLEFTAGATLCKGLNRALGTLCAGSLAFLVEFVANESGQVIRAVFIGIAVFLIGSFATYLRFFPYVKKNYDYGVLIFILTFNLITVSSYRVENVLNIARERSFMIAIGCGICLLMSLLVFPNWSGEDLHNSAVFKLESLATSIEACVKQYFQDMEINGDQSSKDYICKGYKSVLDSKSADETLALYASWEPSYSRHFRRKFPWKQYVRLGDALRHFGYTAVALHGCLQSEIQAPRFIRATFRSPCTRVAEEVKKVLIELASSIRHRRRFSQSFLSDNLNEALQDLNKTFKSQPRLLIGSYYAHEPNNAAEPNEPTDQNQRKESESLTSLSSNKIVGSTVAIKPVGEAQLKLSERRALRPTLSKIAITGLEFSEALPFAAFASSLVEMVARLEIVIEEVEELGRVANFKELSPDMEIVVHDVGVRHRREVEIPNLSSQGVE